MTTNLALHSVVTGAGTLELYLDKVETTLPAAGEVVVEMLASPINPSDLRSLIGVADPASARRSTRDGRPSLSIDVSEGAMASMRGRIGLPLISGHEGCGIVVEAGAAPSAQRLLGKMVALDGRALHGRYATVAADHCLELPEGTDPADGAACYVNPVTALAFAELCRMDGYQGIVHTAAASSLGQMLVKICAADGVPLVNIVRSREQMRLLEAIGAKHCVDSSSPSFRDDLVDAIAQTGATLAFDAIGGGPLVGEILHAMEAAATRSNAYSNYGSDSFKQVYIYGGLDLGQTMFTRRFGFAWSISGFLLKQFLKRGEQDALERMRARVLAELQTTFRTTYSRTLSMEELLDPAMLIECNAKKTNAKFLLRLDA